MYPDLSYIFHDLIGTAQDNWLSIFKTFGMFLVLAILTAAFLLHREMKRKAAQGLFKPEKVKVKENAPATTWDLVSNAVFGFILGFKGFYAISNFAEFQKALDIQGIGTTNIIYADRDDNIYYLGNGNFPHRDPAFNWKKVLPGNTSANLWEPSYFPQDSLAQVLNPASGWVFNSNNQPFNATAPGENLLPRQINSTMGYFQDENNRSLRFPFLMKNYQQLSFTDFKEIKYDQSWMPAPSYTFNMSNVEDLFRLDPEKYPKLAGVINILKNWDRRASVDSKGATVFIMVIRQVIVRLDKEVRLKELNVIQEEEWVAALEYVRKYLLKHHNSIEVPLGQLQRHIRGEVNLPVGGAPDVLAAIYSKPHKKGQYKIFAGESYIQLVQYAKDGIHIESVVPYGSSAHPESPHFSDQMEMYTRQQTKVMTFDKEKILESAERIYHPAE